MPSFSALVKHRKNRYKQFAPATPSRVGDFFCERKMYFPWGNCRCCLAIFKELFALKEDFAKVPIIVQIIRFPPLNKPNFGRLCHY
jgi:hypothetical protein